MSSLLKKELVQPAELPKLSPSSINLFIQDKALWVLKHFYGQTSGFNIHAMRGVSVEEGVNQYLSYDPSLPKSERLSRASEHAKTDFGTKAFFWGDEVLLTSIEDMIDPWVRQCVVALEEVHPFETPTTQIEILTEINGVTIGGYIDYTFSDLQVDLKTANKVKTAISRGPRKGMLPADKAANVRQQAIYNKATGLPTSLLYVSPEEHYHHILLQEELDNAMEEVVVSVNEMKALLEMPIEDIIANSVPNWKAMNYSFYWDESLRMLARRLWEDYATEEEY